MQTRNFAAPCIDHGRSSLKSKPVFQNGQVRCKWQRDIFIGRLDERRVGKGKGRSVHKWRQSNVGLCRGIGLNEGDGGMGVVGEPESQIGDEVGGELHVVYRLLEENVVYLCWQWIACLIVMLLTHRGCSLDDNEIK